MPERAQATIFLETSGEIIPLQRCRRCGRVKLAVFGGGVGNFWEKGKDGTKTSSILAEKLFSSEGEKISFLGRLIRNGDSFSEKKGTGDLSGENLPYLEAWTDLAGRDFLQSSGFSLVRPRGEIPKTNCPHCLRVHVR